MLAAAGGRGDGDGAADGDAGARDAVDPVPGSGVMMLTAGVEAAEGKSALVGLPVGIDRREYGDRSGPRRATGTFHSGA